MPLSCPKTLFLNPHPNREDAQDSHRENIEKEISENIYAHISPVEFIEAIAESEKGYLLHGLAEDGDFIKLGGLLRDFALDHHLSRLKDEVIKNGRK